MHKVCNDLLGQNIILVHGLVKFASAVAYHFCLNLPAPFLQPRTSNISGPSRKVLLCSLNARRVKAFAFAAIRSAPRARFAPAMTQKDLISCIMGFSPAVVAMHAKFTSGRIQHFP